MAGYSFAFFTDWLDRSLNFERSPTKGIFWLDTMRFFTRRLGHPERSYRCLHVAGSKGKGSTSMLAACVLQEAGGKVGVYTSPHICDFRERVCAPGAFFAPSVYEQAARELMAAVDAVGEGELPGGRRPTWFELATLFAMLCFKKAGVEWAVWEVGLGGRLDSTNVVSPDCCLIGPIELEHTDFLGDTLEKIAAEKAGIIKHGVPVVVAAQQTQSVREVFRRKAAEAGSPLLFCDEEASAEVLGYAAGGRDAAGMQVRIASQLFARPLRTTLRLLGSVQAENAALAALALKTVLPSLDEGVMERGLGKAALPGRFEIVSPVAGYGGVPAMVLDGAHTPRSVALTLDSFQKIYGGAQPVLLFACAADKDAEGIARLCTGRFSDVFLTRPGPAKAADMGRLGQAFAAAGIAFRAEEDFAAATAAALEAADRLEKPLLVTGSFYLVAAVKGCLADEQNTLV